MKLRIAWRKLLKTKRRWTHLKKDCLTELLTAPSAPFLWYKVAIKVIFKLAMSVFLNTPSLTYQCKSIHDAAKRRQLEIPSTSSFLFGSYQRPLPLVLKFSSLSPHCASRYVPWSLHQVQTYPMIASITSLSMAVTTVLTSYLAIVLYNTSMKALEHTYNMKI